MSLTDYAIKKAKPKNTVYRLRDKSAATKGLGIAVAPAGSKTFFLGYTSPTTGKRTQVSLGVYPATGLKDARKKAMELRERLSLGIDPKDNIAVEKAAQKAKQSRGTVKDLYDLYIADLKMDKKRSAKEVQRIYDKHIAPGIGSRFADDVSTDDILDLLTPVVQRGALVHADNIRAYMRAAFEIGIHAKATTRWRGKVPDFGIAANPVIATKRAQKKKPVGTRSLSKDEVEKVWNAPGISLASRLAIELLIATGQRVEEVLQATWSEFDLDEMVWTIPASRRKTRHDVAEDHIVPLTGFHKTILAQIKTSTNHDNWLFPHQDGIQPRRSDALYQAVNRFCLSTETQSFAPRDCRRTFKTLAGSIRIDLEMRNRLQGHAMTDVGSRHYDRWSYLPEKREAMEEWSTWLAGIVGVTPPALSPDGGKK
jgi:integrase